MSVPEESKLSELICPMSYAVSRIGNKASLAMDLVRMVDKMDDNYPIPYEASPLVPELQTFHQSAQQFMFTALHEVLESAKELRSCVDKLSVCAACANCPGTCSHENHLSAPEGGM